MIASNLRFAGDAYAGFDELQQHLERLLGLRGSAASSIRSVARGTFPPVNVGSTPEAVEVYAFAPGIDATTLDVTVDKGVLSISGQRPSTPEDGESSAKRTVHASERASGSFRRVMALPDDADPSRVEASYRNGVLHVRIEKREASRPRRIPVNDTH
jgi:HSP20 family protein